MAEKSSRDLRLKRIFTGIVGQAILLFLWGFAGLVLLVISLHLNEIEAIPLKHGAAILLVLFGIVCFAKATMRCDFHIHKVCCCENPLERAYCPTTMILNSCIHELLEQSAWRHRDVGKQKTNGYRPSQTISSQTLLKPNIVFFCFFEKGNGGGGTGDVQHFKPSYLDTEI